MRLGLALGGGGARGAAHVGVLLELERLGIKPRLVTGTSIGGLVGAMVAAGLGTDEMKVFFEEVSLGQLYALPASIPALSSNSKLQQTLERLLGRPTFADLQIPLAVVTVDLVSRREVILDEGDLISAVLATMAIPVLLPPVEQDGMVLIDGGLLNNVPFDIARARGATCVIAVDLANTAPFGTEVENGVRAPATILERALALTRRRRTWQILSAVTDIISSRSLNARLAISQPEVLLQPKLGTISVFDFHRWEEAIEKGCKAVQDVEDELVALAARGK